MSYSTWLSAPLRTYADWLHLRWPDGVPEPLPETGPDGQTRVPGLRIAGDLLGIPLLKFAADSGAAAVEAFFAEGAFTDPCPNGAIDLAIVGGGVAGLSAALAAQQAGLRFQVFEASEPFATITNFTRGKPIFTYPKTMTPRGQLQLSADTKEALLAQLQAQAQAAGIGFVHARVEHIGRNAGLLELAFEDGQPKVQARRVLVCTGRSGDHRTLGVPGEQLDKVFNRLFDPRDYTGKQVLVVGGGDSALEAAVSLQQAGAHVQLSYRGSAFARPKQENIAAVHKTLGAGILFNSRVTRITPDQVQLETPQGELTLANQAVFVMIGREAPVAFLRRSGIGIRGHWSPRNYLSLVAILVTVWAIYRWKTENSAIADWFLRRNWFPNNIDVFSWGLSGFWTDIFQVYMATPGFYYELVYTLVIVGFGLRRIARYHSPYIRRQTLSLIAIQSVPLFLLPYFILPAVGGLGWFDQGAGLWLADQLFPLDSLSGNREYWRSVGFILAWPLFIWNVFSPAPNTLWLIISALQTFVLIPWLVFRYGKGAYCGWICSCGALAETLGDAYRGKMPHGSKWNRLNLAGQAILALVCGLLVLRVAAWCLPGQVAGETMANWFNQAAFTFELFGVPLNYSAVVDYFLSGLLGLGLYFHFSGRTWCRFFCPLAALMHIYARFGQFRIFADKRKCISCNVCTSVCHQGIDIMNFANKGQPMADPQCVRCSACVYYCPTGTLSFGRLAADGTVHQDRLPASPVTMRQN